MKLPEPGDHRVITYQELHRLVSRFASVLKSRGLKAGDPGGKVAGILAQTSGDAVIIGVGLNVSSAADELPFPGATSLALSGANGVDRTALLIAILAALDRRYSQWIDVDGDAAACGLTEAYRAACATIGQQVRVSGTDAEVVVGRAVDIDAGGRLRLDVDGVERSIGAGDVEHLRPV